MVSSRTLVNALSLSRIPIAFLFVLFFQRDKIFFWISVGLCVCACATDIADGHLARRFGIASIHGRLWDSLGDKSFYLAVIVSFNTQRFLSPLVSWALIGREVWLYITRIMYVENLSLVERIRPFTNWHGYFMYAVILLGLINMYGEIESWRVNLAPYIELCAYAALLFGIASIGHYISLK